MDRIISNYNKTDFNDYLYYCLDNEIIYQKDTSQTVEYDKSYFENFVEREDTSIANELNEVRDKFSSKYCKVLLDVGIGSGEFIKKSSCKMYGYDINPCGIEWLKSRGQFFDPYKYVPRNIDGFTCWDVLEHMPEPTEFLDLVRPGMFIFATIPVVKDLKLVEKSKHFKPNEHFYYFTKESFPRYMKDAGFELLEITDGEVKAGREEVLTYAFQKD